MPALFLLRSVAILALTLIATTSSAHSDDDDMIALYPRTIFTTNEHRLGLIDDSEASLPAIDHLFLNGGTSFYIPTQFRQREIKWNAGSLKVTSDSITFFYLAKHVFLDGGKMGDIQTSPAGANGADAQGQPGLGETGGRGGDAQNGADGVAATNFSLTFSKIVFPKPGHSGTIVIDATGGTGGNGGNGGHGGLGGGSQCNQPFGHARFDGGRGGDGGTGGNGGNGGAPAHVFIEGAVDGVNYHSLDTFDPLLRGAPSAQIIFNSDDGSAVVFQIIGLRGGNGGRHGVGGAGGNGSAGRDCGFLSTDARSGAGGAAGKNGIDGLPFFEIQ